MIAVDNGVCNATVMSTTSCASFGLSRQHRAWIALYALQIAPVYRNQVLVQNNVTETDLAEFLDSWLHLKERHQLRQE